MTQHYIHMRLATLQASISIIWSENKYITGDSFLMEKKKKKETKCVFHTEINEVLWPKMDIHTTLLDGKVLKCRIRGSFFWV
jgi:hypothetical protein